MASVAQLESCAAPHLQHYTDEDGNRAFQTYDRAGDPHHLEPTDLLAPALLDAPVRGSHVIAMHQLDGPYRQLRDAMARVLSDPSTADARFEDQDLAADAGPWARVRAALVASNATSGIKASKVTKILHRKCPALVPIFDSKVAGFYGVDRTRPSLLWPILQEELRVHGEWLRELVLRRGVP